MLTPAQLRKADISSFQTDLQTFEDKMRIFTDSKSTITNYSSNAKVFFAWEKITYGDRPFSSFTVSEVQGFVAYLIDDRNLAPRTVNSYICTIRKMYHFVRNETLSPWDVPTRKVDIPLPKVPTVEEVQRVLIMASIDPEAALLVNTLLSTGQRVSEIADMKFSFVNRSDMLLDVPASKGRKERFIPISQSYLDSLTCYCNAYRMNNGHYPSKDAYIFARPDGSPMSTSMLRYRLKKILVLCRLQNKKYGCHSFRHFYGIMLYVNVDSICYHDLYRLSTLLGHKTIAATLIYVQLASAYEVKGSNKLSSPIDMLNASKED